jgi:hypothetical protein
MGKPGQVARRDTEKGFRMNRFAILSLTFASSLLAQIDSSGLRAKFGAPLNRETFTVKPGIEVIVDYSPTANHACRLELPGQAPMPRDAVPGVGINIKKLIDDVLAEIVPLSMRGKELGLMCESAGMISICSKDYEHVSILETLEGGRRTAVIVKFKTADCAAARTAVF